MVLLVPPEARDSLQTRAPSSYPQQDRRLRVPLAALLFSPIHNVWPSRTCLSSKTPTVARSDESAMNLIEQERNFRKFSATAACSVVGAIASSVQQARSQDLRKRSCVSSTHGSISSQPGVGPSISGSNLLWRQKLPTTRMPKASPRKLQELRNLANVFPTKKHPASNPTANGSISMKRDTRKAEM